MPQQLGRDVAHASPAGQRRRADLRSPTARTALVLVGVMCPGRPASGTAGASPVAADAHATRAHRRAAATSAVPKNTPRPHDATLHRLGWCRIGCRKPPREMRHWLRTRDPSWIAVENP